MQFAHVAQPRLGDDVQMGAGDGESRAGQRSARAIAVPAPVQAAGPC